MLKQGCRLAVTPVSMSRMNWKALKVQIRLSTWHRSKHVIHNKAEIYGKRVFVTHLNLALTKMIQLKFRIVHAEKIIFTRLKVPLEKSNVC